MSANKKRMNGMPPAEGLVAEPAAQIKGACPPHEVDELGNIWFDVEIDLNEIRKQIGEDQLHSYLSSVCGLCKVKIERLNADQPLPSLMGVGMNYQDLRAAAKKRGLLTHNVRVSQAPAAFLSIPSSPDRPIVDAILTI